jgi:hypothetical protein
MATLVDVVAAVVVHSSAVAYSHFGVTLEPLPAPRPVAVERIVARAQPKVEKLTDCPPARTRMMKT